MNRATDVDALSSGSTEEHPDVRPWFHDNAEPGPYTDDPEDGYPYDE